MKFKVLSHAGLLVEDDAGAGRLLFDPWLLGSCYWRSWWNLPAPSPELLAQIKPTAIYLTHLHWDHFHGPSLRLFDANTRIYVPKINHLRMVEDLNYLGFHNVVEIPHGGTVAISHQLQLHSFQFGPSNDSAAIVTDGKQALYNLNDCRLFGLALRELTGRFGAPDFLLRSHSSATAVPYCVEDYHRLPSPRPASEYAEEFLRLATKLNARYAIPFASNHCFVHPETISFNQTAATPQLLIDVAKKSVPNYVDRLKVMPPGSSYDNIDGFQIQPFDYSDVSGYVDFIRTKHQDKFLATQAQEDATGFDRGAFESYFSDFRKNTQRFLRSDSFGFAVRNGDGSVARMKITAAGISEYRATPEVDVEIECHARIINDCTQIRMFSTWSASKRLKVRLRESTDLPKLGRLLTLLDAYEHKLLPLPGNFGLRSLGVRARRWREAVEAGRLGWHRLRHGRMPTPLELYDLD